MRWEEATAHGQALTLGELCRDCPDLLDDFRRLIGWVGEVAPPPDRDDAPADEPEVGFTAGRYRTLAVRGSGGFGRVYVAEDTELGRNVALKCLHAEHAVSPAARGQFLQEAEVTARLEHPGVVP